MSDTCPIPTPTESQYFDVLASAERTMFATICKALEDAASEASEGLQASGFRDDPPGHDYFVAVAHEKLFVLLCGGDPETFVGGNPDIAARIIDNSRKMSDHYWLNSGGGILPDAPAS